MNLRTLKDSIDLVSVVQRAGVELKSAGSRHVGLCPFHGDKTPSFYVFPDGYFKCFGCGEYGDAVDFVEKLHGCTFKEALGILGVEQGELTPEKREEIKKLQHQRELVKAFRRWEINAADEAAMLCRCCRQILGEIKTPEDLEKYGDRYHDLESYQYHLDILIDHDDQAKLGLYNAGDYERF